MKKLLIGGTVVAALALTITAEALEIFKTSTGSMRPGYAVGDRIVANELAYGFRVFGHELARWGTPARGEVVLFRTRGKTYFKRVVAVAGDRIRFDGTDVYVGDEKLARTGPEDYEYTMIGMTEVEESRRAKLFWETPSGGDDERAYGVIYDDARPVEFPRPGEPLPGLTCDETSCEVSGGHVFVVGDNRNNSADSRLWGALPIDDVLGRIM